MDRAYYMSYIERPEPVDKVLEEKFQKAAKEVRELASKPTNSEMLGLYALYKQATIGDCKESKPHQLDVKGKAKWIYWSAKKGTKKEEAQKLYIEKVESLIAKLGKKS